MESNLTELVKLLRDSKTSGVSSPEIIICRK